MSKIKKNIRGYMAVIFLILVMPIMKLMDNFPLDKCIEVGACDQLMKLRIRIILENIGITESVGLVILFLATITCIIISSKLFVSTMSEEEKKDARKFLRDTHYNGFGGTW